MPRLIKWFTLPAFVLGLAACEPVSAPGAGTGVSSPTASSGGTRASRYQGSRAGVR